MFANHIAPVLSNSKGARMGRSYTLHAFCGALGWLVVAQSMYFNVLNEVVRPRDACLITQKDPDELRCAVRADDGYVYDAAALREWLVRCLAARRAPCVIPDKPIGVVTPVRVARVDAPSEGGRLRSVATQTGGRLRSVATQTDEPPPKRRRVCVGAHHPIPSEHSAFRRVVARCGPR